ncbi:MAG: hypothetical protein LBR38_03245 [Synergistaceae bacterium]|nr:hypothetical protein [Synergistaceae bacterium]
MWELIRSKVQAWERGLDSGAPIVIPTSGGYDSRILNWMVSDKSRIRSFTYGDTTPQSESTEVLYARELARRLGTKWEQVELDDFLTYIDRWHEMFGVSTHTHGMYHMEFYTKIRERLSPEFSNTHLPLLSGIIGDIWAGMILPEIPDPSRLVALGYTHGLCADHRRALPRHPESEARLEWWEKKKAKLADPRVRVLEANRMKNILLCYLLRVPKSMNYAPYGPLAEMDAALAMLKLPFERRKGRVWQVEFFERHGIFVNRDVPTRRLEKNSDLSAWRKHPQPPLNVSILREFIEPSYVEWVNKYVHSTPWDSFQVALRHIRGYGRLLKTLAGTDEVPGRPMVQAHCAYLTLLPLQKLLLRREGRGVE